ncbi:hypothetical protein BC828DRAFT_21505 [Blastocladiella britannica]|nr:hypothetical protein BC828DRAFT_21505 [Blastocladiella britannica]
MSFRNQPSTFGPLPPMAPLRQLLAASEPTAATAAPGSEGVVTAVGKSPPPAVTIRVSSLEKSLFNITYLACRNNDVSPQVAWILMAIEDLLWLSFAFNSHLISDLPLQLSIVTEPVRAFVSYQGFVAINVIALLLVFSAVFMIATAGFMLHMQAKVPITMLRVMRWTITLLLTTLSIPVASVMVEGLNCNAQGNLVDFTVPCTSAQHLPLLILNVLGMVIYVPFLLIGALVFIETSPTSTSPVARTHGRIDMLAVSLRLLFVVFEAFSRNIMDSTVWWLYMATVALGLAYQTYKYVTMLPYYNSVANQMRAGTTAASTMAMATCLAMSVIANGPTNLMTSNGSHGTWIALLPAAAVGFLSGVVLVRWETTDIVKRTIAKWHLVANHESNLDIAAAAAAGGGGCWANAEGDTVLDPPEMSIKSAAPGLLRLSPQSAPLDSITIQDAPRTINIVRSLEASAAAVASIRRSPGSMRQVRSPSGTSLMGPMPAAGRIGSTGPPLVSDTASVLEASSVHLTTLRRGTGAEAMAAAFEKPKPKITNVFTSPAQVEISVRFVRSNPGPKQTALGLDLLERGLAEFPADPLMVLLAVAYLSAYYGPDGVRAADALMARLGSFAHALPLDIKFLAFSRERAARDMGAHVLDRAAMDALERDMRMHHMYALYLVRDVWELIRTAALPEQVSAAVGRLAVHANGAGATYAKLLERNPRDKNLLRSYAQFLTYIDADTNKAAQVLQEAEDVEYAQSRATHQNHRPSLSMERRASAAESEHDLPAPRAAPELMPSPVDHEIPDAAPSHAKMVEAPTGNNKIAFSAHATEFTSDAVEYFGKVGKLGSDTSGTSASKIQRQKQMLRLAVTDRVLQPLYATQPLYFAVLVTLATCAAGFIVCRGLFTATVNTLAVVFDHARQTRIQAVNIIDDIRGIVYANILNDRDMFNTYYGGLVASVYDMVTRRLPNVMASQATLTTAPPTFRMFQAQQLKGVNDFAAVSLNGLQTAQKVVLAGKMVLGYSFGQLTSDASTSVSGIRLSQRSPNQALSRTCNCSMDLRDSCTAP